MLDSLCARGRLRRALLALAADRAGGWPAAPATTTRRSTSSGRSRSSTTRRSTCCRTAIRARPRQAFEEVERQHPYSQWATRAQLMSAYAFYEANDYDEAVAAARRFIDLHPGHQDVAYAYYLIGVVLLRADLRRRPRPEEHRARARGVRGADAALSRTATMPATPGSRPISRAIIWPARRWTIGRYYLRRGKYVAAINRFRSVIERYQSTTHVPEALHRLTEAYLALGVAEEARRTAAVLGYNFPSSRWYLDSYALVNGGARAVSARARGGSPGDARAPDRSAAGMLTSLAIRDIVLIERLDLEFAAGPVRADRRDRRRQVDPAGCGRPRARRARRPRAGAPGCRAGLGQRGVHRSGRRPACAPARRARHRGRGRAGAAPAGRRRRPLARLRQRPAGQRRAAAPARRAAGRGPRPARAAGAARARRCSARCSTTMAGSTPLVAAAARRLAGLARRPRRRAPRSPPRSSGRRARRPTGATSQAELDDAGARAGRGGDAGGDAGRG